MPSTSSTAQLILTKILTGQGYTIPTNSTWYIGLSTTPIMIDGAGVSEPTSGNYYRAGVNKDYWDFAENSIITNGSQIRFHEATANWGDIKEIFISNSNVIGTSGSYIFFHQPLYPSIPVENGTTVIIQPKSLIIKRDSEIHEMR